MKKTVYTLLIFCSVVFLFASCANDSVKEQPLRVIFETDMGNDIDDALALDMLYKYADQNKVDLLAVSSNKNSHYSARYIALMNSFYGYSSLLVGEVKNGADSEGDAVNYTEIVCEYAVDSQKVFTEVERDFEESVRLYRKILSDQPDNSVVIISVGFSTNLAQLLESSADEFSDLTGRELVAKKVKLLSMMAGNFSRNPQKLEYNIMKDIPAAKKVFNEWPTPIVTSPFGVGNSILYPASSIENDFNWTEYHPLVIGYKNYLQMPYDRQTWDLTAVLYAVEPNENYFSLSESGVVTVNDEGYTLFEPESGGNHQFLKVDSIQQERVRSRFIDLITQIPKVFSNEKE